jgi:predicted metalloprotease with PDZ domain
MRSYLLGIIVLSLSAATVKPAADPIRYTLSPIIEGGSITALRVEIRFRADPSGTTQIGWDDSWAGEGKLWQWARGFQVTGGSAVEKKGSGRWWIKAAPGAQLTATYSVTSAYDHDPTVVDSAQARPVVRPRWFYAMGSALFAYPSARESAPATFDWSGPPEIRFASDLEHLAGRTRKPTRPGTVSDVLESVVIGGNDLRVFATDQNSGIRVATLGHYKFTSEQLDALARNIIGIERSFWRANRSAPFLVTAAPIVGTPAAKGFSGTGRSDAFALWIDQYSSIDSMKWLLAHEYFHTWNSELLGSMPADRALRPTHYWLSEGFTDYYARALLVRSGVISPAEFVSQWNEMLLAYANSPVRTAPGGQAAAAFWSNYFAEKLPYQRGAMLAAIWNARLLTASRRGKNLDAVMRAQLTAAQTSKAEATSLFRSVAKYEGLSIGADERRYLTDGEPILLPANTFGPCVTIITKKRPIFSRGYDPEATAAANNVVTGLDATSPAYMAGLRDGMKIVLRTEGELNNAVIPYALLIEDRGKQRTIRYLPQGHGQVLVQQLKLSRPLSSTCSKTFGGMAKYRR